MPCSSDRFRIHDRYGKHTRKQFMEFRYLIDPLYINHQPSTSSELRPSRPFVRNEISFLWYSKGLFHTCQKCQRISWSSLRATRAMGSIHSSTYRRISDFILTVGTYILQFTICTDVLIGPAGYRTTVVCIIVILWL